MSPASRDRPHRPREGTGTSPFPGEDTGSEAQLPAQRSQTGYPCSGSALPFRAALGSPPAGSRVTPETPPRGAPRRPALRRAHPPRPLPSRPAPPPRPASLPSGQGRVPANRGPLSPGREPPPRGFPAAAIESPPASPARVARRTPFVPAADQHFLPSAATSGSAWRAGAAGKRNAEAAGTRFSSFPEAGSRPVRRRAGLARGQRRSAGVSSGGSEVAAVAGRPQAMRWGARPEGRPRAGGGTQV